MSERLASIQKLPVKNIIYTLATMEQSLIDKVKILPPIWEPRFATTLQEYQYGYAQYGLGWKIAQFQNRVINESAIPADTKLQTIFGHKYVRQPKDYWDQPNTDFEVLLNVLSIQNEILLLRRQLSVPITQITQHAADSFGLTWYQYSQLVQGGSHNDSFISAQVEENVAKNLSQNTAGSVSFEDDLYEDKEGLRLIGQFPDYTSLITENQALDYLQEHPTTGYDRARAKMQTPESRLAQIIFSGLLSVDQTEQGGQFLLRLRRLNEIARLTPINGLIYPDPEFDTFIVDAQEKQDRSNVKVILPVPVYDPKKIEVVEEILAQRGGANYLMNHVGGLGKEKIRSLHRCISRFRQRIK